MKALFKATAAYIKKCDLMLLAIAVTASLMGLVAVYSATLSMGSDKYMIVQAAAIALGCIGFFIITLFDLDRFGDLWIWAYLFNLVFLFSLRFLGTGGETTGNNSWIRFGPIGIQPAEIGKLIFIFTFARHIYVLRDRINRPSSVLQLIFHALSTAGFVYIFSDDLGMCIIYLMIFIIMFFASCISMKWFLSLCAGGLASLAPLWMFVLKPYHKYRILVLFDPDINPDIAYHGIQSMIAVGGGKLFGYGYLQGPQTQYATLPEKHNDFIFSTICEEWGFIGGVAVILVLCLLVWRIYHDAFEAYDRFSYLVCIGIGGMFMSQILINIGMCLGIMPVIGITLPFFSYGGTSVVTCFGALGIVCGLKMRERPERLR